MMRMRIQRIRKFKYLFKINNASFSTWSHTLLSKRYEILFRMISGIGTDTYIDDIQAVFIAVKVIQTH